MVVHTFANPKSVIFRWPSRSRRRFSGFKSLKILKFYVDRVCVSKKFQGSFYGFVNFSDSYFPVGTVDVSAQQMIVYTGTHLKSRELSRQVCPYILILAFEVDWLFE